MGEVLSVEFRMRDLLVLTMQPRETPCIANCRQRNMRSLSGTTVETLSIYAIRLMMPPWLLLWGLLLASWVSALALSALSIGLSSCVTTSAQGLVRECNLGWILLP